MFLDKILHNDAIQRNISPSQQFLIQQLLPHELHKQVLVFLLDFGQQRFIRGLLYAAQFLHVFAQCGEVIFCSLLLLLALLSADELSFALCWAFGVQNGAVCQLGFCLLLGRLVLALRAIS